jgi:hypothetical protein
MAKGKRYGRNDFRQDMAAQREKDEMQSATDEHLRQLTFALLRRMGRCRISPDEIQALDPRDQVHFSTDNSTGDIIVTYTCAVSEEPGAAPKLAVGTSH